MDGRPVKLDLRPCRNCGRTFVPESLVKHEASCKNVQKKRKVFDMSKQRVTEDLSLKQIKQAQKKTTAPPKSHWRQKHQEFIQNIRAAKGAQVAMERGDPLPPPPPPSLNPDYVSCPYCDRRFNEKAAERHISFCKEQQKRLVNKRVPSQQEKARAAAKGYQAPKPKGRGSPAADMGGYSSQGRAPPPGGRAPAGRADVGHSPAGGQTGYAGRGRGTSGPTAPRGRTTTQARTNRTPVRPPDLTVQAEQIKGVTTKPCSPYLRHHPSTLRDDMDANLIISPPSSKSSSAVRPTPATTSATRKPLSGYGNHRMPPNPKPSSQGTMGQGQISLHGLDSGYYSSTSESDVAAAVPKFSRKPRDNKIGDGHSPLDKTPPARVTGSLRKPRPNSGAAKFCHECGCHFQSMQVKFCTECGIKRLQVTAQ